MLGTSALKRESKQPKFKQVSLSWVLAFPSFLWFYAIVKNVITLDFTDNPKLAELFSRKSPGEKCRMEVTLTLKNKTETGIEGTIDEIVADRPDKKKKPDDTEKITDKPLRMDITSSEPDTTEVGEGY